MTPELSLDVAISASGATADLIEDMARIGPFGAGNPEPVCAALDVTVAYADVVGEKHVRMKLVGPDGTRLDAIAFRSVDTALGEGLLKARGSRVHVAGALRMDHWNGRARVQLLVEDATAGRGLKRACQARFPVFIAPVLRAPFVYRLGLKIFNLARGVRLP